MGNDVVTLRDVGFTYGGQDVLHNINLSLRAGEITCLLGQSGCGKTTLLQLCAGLLKPQTGTIESAFARPGPSISYMQQNGGLLPWRTVLENVALGPELLGQKPDKVKALQALGQVGLADKANILPEFLSGGQQQRVALARQLVMQPKLLLLDEPLGALDIVLRQNLAQLIKQIVKEQNIAALVVTHSPDEAIFLADHLFLLGGRPATVTQHWHIGDNLCPETAFHDVVKAMQEAHHV